MQRHKLLKQSSASLWVKRQTIDQENKCLCYISKWEGFIHIPPLLTNGNHEANSVSEFLLWEYVERFREQIANLRYWRYVGEARKKMTTNAEHKS